MGDYRIPNSGYEWMHFLHHKTAGNISVNIAFNGKCYVCMRDAQLRCSRCKKVYYCCKECQQKDWNKHREMCNITIKFPIVINDG